MSEKNLWLAYVGLAGLAWGTYVPIIFYGGSELGGKASSRFLAILCVGVAYFLIGVLFPLLMFFTRWGGIHWGDVDLNASGLIFSSLAGVAGAVGAICVIFAAQSAVAAGKGLTPPNPSAFRVYIAPLIFGLAPIINVLVSMVWHPQKGQPFHFGFEMPGWKLWVGIVLVGVGAALVLFSKEEAEAGKQAHAVNQAVAVAAQPSPSIPEVRP
jgi:hypothetical protein